MKIKENEKRVKYLDLVRELEKLWNMKVTGVRIIIDMVGTILRLGKGTVRTENRRTSRDHLNTKIVKIGLKRVLETWGRLAVP